MITRSLKAICLCLLCANLSACGLSVVADPKTNPVLEDRIGLWGRQPVGTLATTAERRVVLVRIAEDDPDTFGKFCAEPPPDAAENIASKLALALEAGAKITNVDPAGKIPEGEASARLETAKEIATSVQSLFHRSQGLQFYRDGMYNLCQGYLNKVINGDEFAKRADDLSKKSYALIKLELELTKGIIGGTPEARKPVLSETSDKDRVSQLRRDLKKAMDQKDEAKAKEVLAMLYDILVIKNAKAAADEGTMAGKDLKDALKELSSLAKKESRDKLQPTLLKDLDKEKFQGYFVPFDVQ